MTSWLRKPSTERLTAAIVVIMSVASLVYAIIIGNRTTGLAECQLGYATGFADALDARSAASQESAEAQDDLWRTVRDGFRAPGPTARAEFEGKLNAYLDARDRARAAQLAHPLKAPRDLCPDLLR